MSKQATSEVIVHGQIVPMPADLTAGELRPRHIAVEVQHLHGSQFARVLYLVGLPEPLATAGAALPAGAHIAVLGGKPVACDLHSENRPVFRLQAHEIEVCLQCLMAHGTHFRPAPGLRGTLMLNAHGGCFGNPPLRLGFFADAPADAISCPRCGLAEVHVIRYRAWCEGGEAAAYELRGLKLALDGFVVLVSDPDDDTDSVDEIAQCQHCGHEGDLAAFDKYGLNFGGGWARVEDAPLASTPDLTGPELTAAANPAPPPANAYVYVGVEIYRDQGPSAVNWDYRFAAASPHKAIELALKDAIALGAAPERVRFLLHTRGRREPEPVTRQRAEQALKGNPDVYVIMDRGDGDGNGDEAVMIVCDGLAG